MKCASPNGTSIKNLYRLRMFSAYSRLSKFSIDSIISIASGVSRSHSVGNFRFEICSFNSCVNLLIVYWGLDVIVVVLICLRDLLAFAETSDFFEQGLIRSPGHTPRLI